MNLGTYRPHSLFIRIRSIADLQPGSDEPMACAVPVHAHEYVHFLHNVSTICGINLFRANLWLVLLMRACTDNQGRVVRREPLNEDLKHWFGVATAWNKGLYGGATWAGGTLPEKVAAWKFKELSREVWRLDLPSFDDLFQWWTVHVEAETCDGPVTGRLAIGYDLISEGVAYEVERQLYCERGIAEAAIDKSVPAYPYLVFQPLIEHLVGRPTTTLERIQLGVLSLMTTSPAQCLLYLCQYLRKTPVSPDPRGLPQDLVEDVLGDFKQNRRNSERGLLVPDLEMVFSGGLLEVAGEIRALFKAAMDLRACDPFLECRFLGQQIDAASFYARIGQLLDCCILQEKPHEGVQLEWVGPGIVATHQRSAELLGLLQAAFHYTTRHLHKQRFLLTSELPKAQCPFAGCCNIQEEDGWPIECDERPWDRFRGVPKDERKCLYAKAVRTFISRAA